MQDALYKLPLITQVINSYLNRKLAWEHGVVHLSYSRRLPALGRIFVLKVDPLNLASQKQAKNIPLYL